MNKFFVFAKRGPLGFRSWSRRSWVTHERGTYGTWDRRAAWQALHRYIEAWQAPWMETINFKRILFKPFRDEEIVPALHKDERGERGPPDYHHLAYESPRHRIHMYRLLSWCLSSYRQLRVTRLDTSSSSSSSFPSPPNSDREFFPFFILFRLTITIRSCLDVMYVEVWLFLLCLNEVNPSR